MSHSAYCFKDIESAVCQFFQIAPASLRTVQKNNECARRRFIAVRLARELTALSYPALGDRLHKDHSTMVNANRRAAELAASDESFADQLAGVKEILFHQTPYLERVRIATANFAGGSTSPSGAAKGGDA